MFWRCRRLGGGILAVMVHTPDNAPALPARVDNSPSLPRDWERVRRGPLEVPLVALMRDIYGVGGLLADGERLGMVLREVPWVIWDRVVNFWVPQQSLWWRLPIVDERLVVRCGRAFSDRQPECVFRDEARFRLDYGGILGADGVGNYMRVWAYRPGELSWKEALRQVSVIGEDGFGVAIRTVGVEHSILGIHWATVTPGSYGLVENLGGSMAWMYASPGGWRVSVPGVRGVGGCTVSWVCHRLT